MSRAYSAPKCEYRIDGNRIVTDGTVRNKITGTTLSGILEVSPWSSPFQVACNLLGLAREEIGDKPSVITGQVLEPVIISYADRAYPNIGMFVPAEKIFEKREGDHDSWASDFEDDVFAGHVDGAVITDDGTSYILEIKTSANLASWENGVPEYYYWQVALYNEFLAKQDRAYVVLGIVDDATYRNPMTWMPNERSVAMFDLALDRERIQSSLESAREWYAMYILEGQTPPYNPDIPGDVEMFEHLQRLTSSIGDMEAVVDRIAEIDGKIALAEAENKELYEEQKALREQVKEYMMVHDLRTLGKDTNTAIAKISTTKRSGIDRNLMMLDNIDPDKYTVTNETYSIRINKNKSKE